MNISPYCGAWKKASQSNPFPMWLYQLLMNDGFWCSAVWGITDCRCPASDWHSSRFLERFDNIMDCWRRNMLISFNSLLEECSFFFHFKDFSHTFLQKVDILCPVCLSKRQPVKKNHQCEITPLSYIQADKLVHHSLLIQASSDKSVVTFSSQLRLMFP